MNFGSSVTKTQLVAANDKLRKTDFPDIFFLLVVYWTELVHNKPIQALDSPLNLHVSILVQLGLQNDAY
jgi:hypothetical protein